jgi:hypothetical protein
LLRGGEVWGSVRRLRGTRDFFDRLFRMTSLWGRVRDFLDIL